MKHDENVWYYILLSIIGGVLILVIILTSVSEMHSIEFLDRLFIGGAFISSCLFGISLAFRPNWIKRFSKHGSKDIHNQKPQTTTRKHQGHHPDCEHFQSHTITVKNKVLCAGCTGLALGSFISIFLTIIRLSILNEIPKITLYIFIIAGMIFVALNYVEIILTKRRTFAHVIGNILLVIGFFFVIVGVFQLTGNILYGIFAFIITFLWLDTRIQLSNWHHAETCKNCGEVCKAYKA